MSNSKKSRKPQIRSKRTYTGAAPLAMTVRAGQGATGAVKILGMGDVEIQSVLGMIKTVRAGIPMRAMRNLMAHANISIDEMAGYTHTPRATLSRYHANKKLNIELSERTAEIANLYSKGENVFGDNERFKAWMSQPSLPLGNKRPKDYLDTSFGIQLLIDELTRIEHGIFA